MTDMVDTQAAPHGTYKSYTVGFVLSMILTLISFYMVSQHILAGWTLGLTISVLAIVQLIVQLAFFMNLGKEAKPRWNTIIFIFMALVVGIIVFGSLWNMWDLDKRVMVPMQMKDLQHQE
jgi:cytochrome o ubiquinol oxidase subunit IV